MGWLIAPHLSGNWNFPFACFCFFFLSVLFVCCKSANLPLSFSPLASSLRILPREIPQLSQTLLYKVQSPNFATSLPTFPLYIELSHPMVTAAQVAISAILLASFSHFVSSRSSTAPLAFASQPVSCTIYSFLSCSHGASPAMPTWTAEISQEDKGTVRRVLYLSVESLILYIVSSRFWSDPTTASAVALCP